MAKRAVWGALAVLVGVASAGHAAAQSRPPLPPMPPIPVRPARVPDARPPLPDMPSIVTPPRWVRQAMPEFPERAQARNVSSGHVRLECTAGVTSRLSGCVILEESPRDMGFGAAAIRGAQRAIVEPRMVNGEATPSQVAFNVDFKLAD